MNSDIKDVIFGTIVIAFILYMICRTISLAGWLD